MDADELLEKFAHDYAMNYPDWDQSAALRAAWKKTVQPAITKAKRANDKVFRKLRKLIDLSPKAERCEADAIIDDLAALLHAE